jgi:hypothetical protein
MLWRGRSRSVGDLRGLLRDYDRMQEEIDTTPRIKGKAHKLPTLPTEQKEYTFHMYDPNEKPAAKKPKQAVCPLRWRLTMYMRPMKNRCNGPVACTLQQPMLGPGLHGTEAFKTPYARPASRTSVSSDRRPGLQLHSPRGLALASGSTLGQSLFHGMADDEYSGIGMPIGGG